MTTEVNNKGVSKKGECRGEQEEYAGSILNTYMYMSLNNSVLYAINISSGEKGCFSVHFSSGGFIVSSFLVYILKFILVNFAYNLKQKQFHSSNMSTHFSQHIVSIV